MNVDDILLRAVDIEKSFSGVKVLKKVGLDIRRGEVHAVMGENGAGKSTLIKVLTGVYPRDEGKIFFNGASVTINSRQDAKDLGIAVIYQELSLIPTLTVAQNILLGQEICRAGILDNGAMKLAIRKLIETYGFSLNPDAIVETLSIAQRQTVEILKALSMQSSLIIMDEPTASLSVKESENLFQTIGALKKRGVSILYISHRLEEVYRLADRLTILRDGERIAVLSQGEINPRDVIRLMIGKELRQSEHAGRMRPSRPEVVLRVRNLSRRGVFSDISFDLHRGEVLGIGGLVGSGRSEILHCLFGSDRPDSGDILFEGKPIRGTVSRNIRSGFGLVPEDRRTQGFIPLLSMKRNIVLTNYDHLVGRRLFISGKSELAMCRDAIQRLDIRPANSEIHAGNLSGGNQQKVVVGKWLMRDLKMLLIDEPTAGIDVGVKEDIYALIGELAEKGVAVILVSSDLPELLRISHRILVMRKGRIFREFSEGSVSQEDVLKAASGIQDREIESNE
jgi:ribose transport system ATP-binding protein